jgi:hypothetical protein
MSGRRLNGFLYGLFMDVAILRSTGVMPTDPRPAYVDNFALRIGQRATLIPSAGARAYGMLIALTDSEMARLYDAPGLEQYRPEPVVTSLLEGGVLPALCYNLRSAPHIEERNPDYALRLQRVLRDLNCFPSTYIESVTSC